MCAAGADQELLSLLARGNWAKQLPAGEPRAKRASHSSVDMSLVGTLLTRNLACLIQGEDC